jgi:histidinol-phosphate aminotransferase
MRELSRTSTETVLVYVCNPNNPTASLTPSRQIEQWIEAAPENVHFLVDEAYYHYVEDDSYRSAIPLALKYPNVIVTRTFSKVYALAGLRIGYAVAHPDTCKRLELFASAGNINHLALQAALACLEEDTFVEKSLRVNNQGRQILYRCLQELEIEYIPSHTNFVMFRIRGDLKQFISRMVDNQVWVGRPFPPFLSYNRVSIGLPREMNLFAEKLREFRSKGWI